MPITEGPNGGADFIPGATTSISQILSEVETKAILAKPLADLTADDANKMMLDRSKAQAFINHLNAQANELLLGNVRVDVRSTVKDRAQDLAKNASLSAFANAESMSSIAILRNTSGILQEKFDKYDALVGKLVGDTQHKAQDLSNGLPITMPVPLVEYTQEPMNTKFTEFRDGKSFAGKLTLDTSADPTTGKIESATVSLDSMKQVLSDLDRDGAVEVKNTNWFRKTLLRAGEQNFVIGEAQVQHEIAKLDKVSLDALANRLGVVLPWVPEKKEYNEKTETLSFEITRGQQKALNDFRDKLISKIDMLSAIAQVALGDNDGGIRTGLTTVINGKEQEFVDMLEKPANLARLTAALQQGSELKDNKNIFNEFVGGLMRMGILVPVALLSQGVVGGFIETTDITVAGEKGGLSLKKDIGTSGSAKASIDLVGFRLEGNWNDPSTRIKGRMEYVMKNMNTEGITNLTGDVMKDFASSTPDLREQAQKLTSSYTEQQKALLSTYKEKAGAQVSALSLAYLSRIEQLKGNQLKGAFAAVTPLAWMVGLSGARVDMTANRAGVNTASGTLEHAVNSDTITEPQKIDEKLGLMSVEKTANGYKLPDGTTIEIPEGKGIRWKFSETSSPNGLLTQLEGYEIFDTSKTTVTAEAVQVEPNAPIKIDKLESSLEVAQFMRQLRLTGSPAVTAKVVTWQNAYDRGDINGANLALRALLNGQKSKYVKDIIDLLDKNGDSTASIHSRLLEQSQGSLQSHNIADQITSGNFNSKELISYYEKVRSSGKSIASSFGELYNLPQDKVMSLVKDMSSKITTPSSLGEKVGTNFLAVVAYSQYNGKGRENFRNIVAVNHSNAQIIGEPSVVSDASILERAKTSLRENTHANEWNKYEQAFNNSGITATREEIQDLVIDNKISDGLKTQGVSITTESSVKSFLSFAQKAECFNLGFAITPPIVNFPRTTVTPGENGRLEMYLGVGSIAYSDTARMTTAGFGLGQKLAKDDTPRKDEKPTQSETKPTTEGGGSVDTSLSTTPAVTPTTPAADLSSHLAQSNLNGVDVSGATGAAADAAAKQAAEQATASSLANTVTEVQAAP